MSAWPGVACSARLARVKERMPHRVQYRRSSGSRRGRTESLERGHPRRVPEGLRRRVGQQQQWHTIVYFSAGAIAAVAYGHVTAWSDQQLIFYLMLLIWFLSLISALVVLSLQWWQGTEHRKIDYIASKWSCFVNAARAQVSQAQRHPALRHVPVHAFLSRAGDHRRDPNLLAPDLIPTPRRQSRRRSW